MRWKYLGLTFVLAMFGCSTVKTSFMTVDSSGKLTENPDRCVHGVPAVVQVPTHIEVRINQTEYFRIESVEGAKQLVSLPAATSRNIEVEEIKVNKLIMVDPKRPLSGTGEFSIDYSDDGKGVIDKLNYKAVDETLKNSAALATAAIKAFATSTTTNQKTGLGGANSKLVKVERVIALQRFPINQCSQAEIDAFIGEYINYCVPEDCTTPTTYAK
jgi:hypothetical protein